MASRCNWNLDIAAGITWKCIIKPSPYSLEMHSKSTYCCRHTWNMHPQTIHQSLERQFKSKYCRKQSLNIHPQNHPPNLRDALKIEIVLQTSLKHATSDHPPTIEHASQNLNIAADIRTTYTLKPSPNSLEIRLTFKYCCRQPLNMNPQNHTPKASRCNWYLNIAACITWKCILKPSPQRLRAAIEI